jgi:hypothetical protein
MTIDLGLRRIIPDRQFNFTTLIFECGCSGAHWEDGMIAITILPNCTRIHPYGLQGRH